MKLGDRAVAEQCQRVHERAAPDRVGRRVCCRAPDELAFDYNAFDKPRLADWFSSPLEFNISHSGEWLLLAFAQRRALGIDVFVAHVLLDGSYASTAKTNLVLLLPPTA